MFSFFAPPAEEQLPQEHAPPTPDDVTDAAICERYFNLIAEGMRVRGLGQIPSKELIEEVFKIILHLREKRGHEFNAKYLFYEPQGQEVFAEFDRACGIGVIKKAMIAYVEFINQKESSTIDSLDAKFNALNSKDRDRTKPKRQESRAYYLGLGRGRHNGKKINKVFEELSKDTVKDVLDDNSNGEQLLPPDSSFGGQTQPPFGATAAQLSTTATTNQQMARNAEYLPFNNVFAAPTPAPAPDAPAKATLSGTTSSFGTPDADDLSSKINIGFGAAAKTPATAATTSRPYLDTPKQSTQKPSASSLQTPRRVQNSSWSNLNSSRVSRAHNNGFFRQTPSRQHISNMDHSPLIQTPSARDIRHHLSTANRSSELLSVQLNLESIGEAVNADDKLETGALLFHRQAFDDFNSSLSNRFQLNRHLTDLASGGGEAYWRLKSLYNGAVSHTSRIPFEQAVREQVDIAKSELANDEKLVDDLAQSIKDVTHHTAQLKKELADECGEKRRQLQRAIDEVNRDEESKNDLFDRMEQTEIAGFEAAKEAAQKRADATKEANEVRLSLPLVWEKYDRLAFELLKLGIVLFDPQAAPLDGAEQEFETKKADLFALLTLIEKEDVAGLRSEVWN